MEGQQMSLDIQLEATVPQPKSVECLGMTFENDETRRVYFREKLREKLQDPEFRKRPPIVETNEQHNHFRIELDSRPLEIIIDKFWKQRIGVKVSPEAAKILGLLGQVPVGMTLAQICSGTSANIDDATVMCQELQLLCAKHFLH
jgi:hypothetical protein